MFFRKSLHINEALKTTLASIGLSDLQDFVDYSDGQIVSRPSKRPVRCLYLTVAGHRRKYFLKQTRVESFLRVLKTWRRNRVLHSSPVREFLILELFRMQGIPVMNVVAWGELKIFGWPVKGFLLVEEVAGRGFAEIYQNASLQIRRRMMWVYGELMGTLHLKGIISNVRLRDLIWVSKDYTTFRKCLVVIDREHGQIHSVEISLNQRGRALGALWVEGTKIIGTGERSELLAFLAGYFAASEIPSQNKAMRENLVDRVLRRAKVILACDDRFALLRHVFKEKYDIW